MRPFVFSLLVLGSSLALHLPSDAQEAAPPSEAPPPSQPREIEEIIVTAERREQSVQDVSQSLSVFSLDELSSGNLQDAYDLQLKVPGFVATGGLPAITLRGLGQDSDVLGPGIDPGFQLHINDIYVSQLAVALLGFNDLERVEVLPGPQGTLFGRNSTGGSMNLHTKRPTLGAWEVSGDVDWSRYDNVRVGLALNVPLVDERLAARLFYRREWPSEVNKLRGANGFKQNTTNNALSGGHYFRSTLRWTPSDAITTDLILAYSIDKDDGGSPRPLEPFPAFSPGQRAVFFGGVNPAGATPNSESVRTIRSNRRQTQRYETFWGQAIAEIEIPSHVIKLNANYQFWDYAIDRDQDFTDVDAQRLVLLDKHKTWTGEVSIVSDYAGRFNWLFGANYQDDNAPNTDVPIWNFQEKTELAQFAVFDAFAGFSPFSADAQNVCAGPCVFAPGDQQRPFIRFKSDVRTETGGVFLDGGVDLTETLHIQAGARYSFTSRRMDDTGFLDILVEPFDVVTDGFCNDALGIADPVLFAKENCFNFVVAPLILQPQVAGLTTNTLDAGNVAFLVPWKGNRNQFTLNADPVVKDENWDSVTGHAKLEWRPAEGQLFYASYSRGERHGGFNFFSPDSFPSEEINAYEVGAKNTLLDGRLLLNSTFFYYDLKNRFITETVNNVTQTTTAPGAEIFGVELQWMFSPIERVQISGNVGWLDAEISKDFVTQDNSVSRANPNGFCPTKVYPNTPGSLFAGLPAVGDNHGPGLTCDGALPQNLNGNQLPRSPEWTFSSSAQYTFELARGTLTPRIDFAFRDDVNFRQFENPLDEQKAYTRTDVRLRLDLTDAPLWIEAYAQNLEDRRKVKTQVENQLNWPRYYWLAAPLTFGARVGWQFEGDSFSDLWSF